MSLWTARGEPHSLNSGLGGLPGGGVRNQSSGSLVVRVEDFFPPPTSQLHIPLGFLLWTAGACWKLLFWGLVVVGRTSGPSEAAVLSLWGVSQCSAPSAAESPPQPPTHSLTHSLPSAPGRQSFWLLPPGKLVFLTFCSVPLSSMQLSERNNFYLLCCCSSLLPCSLSWRWSLSAFPASFPHPRYLHLWFHLLTKIYL